MSSAFHHAPQVDAFYRDLLGGQLRGIQPRPALTRDVHDLYRAWSALRMQPALGTSGHFASVLVARHDVPLLRKRYAIGNQLIGPHGVLYLISPGPPRPGFEADWLGEHVICFRAAVAAYRACQGVAEHA